MSDREGKPGIESEEPAENKQIKPVKVHGVDCDYNCGTCGECGRELARLSESGLKKIAGKASL